MMRLSSLNKSVLNYCLLLWILAVSNVSFAAPPKSFTFDLGAPPETLGDIKPAFLNFKQDPVPNIPVKEVIRRYRKLFDTTTDPAVRIDSLHRMTNLESRFGDKRELSPKQEKELYKKALESYELIVGSGVYYKKVDELLYQTAKAYDLTEHYDASIRSLNQLVGLYHNSPLVTEGLFRIGEANFSLGEYKKAESAYNRVLKRREDSKFYDKSLFMMGWSQFKQAHYTQSNNTFITVLDRALARSTSKNLSHVNKLDRDIVADSFRVLAITFSYQQGAEGIEQLVAKTGKKTYTFNLYQNLSQLFIKQERYEDSASTSRAFMKRYPDDPNVPLMAVSIIDAYKKGSFAVNVWDEKAKYINEFGINSKRWRRMPYSTQDDVKPFLVGYLNELSHLNYIRAQKAVKTEQKEPFYRAAANYYVEAVRTDPDAKTNGQNLFLAGESLFQVKDYSHAIDVYKESAYQSLPHKNAVEAGYAAITTFNEMEKSLGALSAQGKQSRQELMLKFADTFKIDKRTPSVLNEVANSELQIGNFEQAVSLSNRVLSHPSSTNKLRLSSWLVNGHGNFESGHFDLAEKAYSSALGFKILVKAKRNILRERLAASIYRQAEQYDRKGETRLAVDNYLRVGRVVPESRIRINAHFDAATRLMAVKDWKRAIAVLGDFQQQFPKSPLNEKIPEKLIFAQLQSGNKAKAASLLLDLVGTTEDKQKAREGLYQASELYEQSGNKAKAFRLLKQYIKQYPKPFALNVEAKMRLADYYASTKALSKRYFWLRKIISADSSAGADRNDRSKFLAVSAASELANVNLLAFNRIKLTLPLKRSLKRKKKALKLAINGYEKVAGYGLIQFTTEATYKLAIIYQQLSQDLLQSQKPRKLNELQLEQYNILLEEQAYPFEEKAIKLYKMNIKRAQNGIFDTWVKESYAQLGKIVPATYKRPERRFDHAVPIN